MANFRKFFSFSKEISNISNRLCCRERILRYRGVPGFSRQGGQFDPYRGAMVLFGAELGDRGAISQKVSRKSKFCPAGTKSSKISLCGHEIFNNSNQISQFFYSKLTTCQPIFEPFWLKNSEFYKIWRFLGNFSIF